MASASTKRVPRGKKGLLAAAVLLVGGLLAACGSTGSGGQSGSEAAVYPEDSITWIVAFDPGGGSDAEARRVQQSLQDELGVEIELQYREGGGGAVGWAEMANEDPDGYTVAGLVVPHIVIQPLALEDPGYQTEDLRPVAWQTGAPSALLVANDSPFKTLEDFVTYAKQHPGEVTVGGVGNFSLSDLALAQLTQSAGIEVSYVPVTGGAGPLVADLAGGHVDTAMLGTSHDVRSDQVRALAVAGDERFEGLPDVPTFAELGYEVTINYAWGVGMPAGVPDEVATKLGQAIIAAMKKPGVEEKVVDEGLEPILIGPDKAQAFLDEQKKTYADLVPLVKQLHG